MRSVDIDDLFSDFCISLLGCLLATTMAAATPSGVHKNIYYRQIDIHKQTNIYMHVINRNLS